MADIKPYNKKGQSGALTIGWFNLTAGDVGLPFEWSRYADKTAHVFGDFGGGTVTLEGSNKLDAMEDPANGQWVVLTDFTASPLTITENTLKLIAQNPRFIRVTVDGVVDVTVSVESNGDS